MFNKSSITAFIITSCLTGDCAPEPTDPSTDRHIANLFQTATKFSIGGNYTGLGEFNKITNEPKKWDDGELKLAKIIPRWNGLEIVATSENPNCNYSARGLVIENEVEYT